MENNKYELKIFPLAQLDMEQIFDYIAVELCNPTAAIGQINDFEKALENVPIPMKVDYGADLERRVRDVIGRNVRIVHKGQNKKLEISFSSNEDLEELLKLICGDEFFDDI